MHYKSAVFFLFLLFLASSCIKNFTPEIDKMTSKKIVISGRFTNKSGFQYLYITKSKPIDELYNEDVSGCNGKITNNQGVDIEIQEFAPGVYRYYVNDSDIQPGAYYSIQITTPDGDQLQSEPDLLTFVADVEEPKYTIDSTYNGIYDYYTRGVQFYLDIKGSENTSNYYLFEVDGTYEHHALHPREWFYDGRVHQIIPPDSSLYWCWTTYRVPEIITLSTDNLSKNEFLDFPLLFISLKAPYFTYGYSLLLHQIGLSREAYNYWENMRLNNNQNGSLYSKQPVDMQGNIKNITHPEQEILGFFSACSIEDIRIFIDAQPTYPNPACNPIALDRGFRDIGREVYPAFLMNNPIGSYLMVWLPEPCVNCTYYSGTVSKPDFWPY